MKLIINNAVEMELSMIAWAVPMEMKQNGPHMNPKGAWHFMSRLVCASTILSASKIWDWASFITSIDMLDSLKTEANDGPKTRSTNIVQSADAGP